MNKQQYLDALQKAFKAANVAEIDDILDEYRQHFDNKLADGYAENEIAAKLDDPKNVASQFAEAQPDRANKTAGALVKFALGFVWIFAGSFFLVLYCFVVVLAAVAVAFLTAGVALLLPSPPAFISVPPMPYICSLIFGIMCLALAVLSAIGAFYCHKYIVSMIRSYNRFNKNTIASVSGEGGVLPPLAVTADVSPVFRRRARKLTIAAAAVFAVCFIAGFTLSAILAGSFEFWHTWGWFA